MPKAAIVAASPGFTPSILNMINPPSSQPLPPLNLSPSLLPPLLLLVFLLPSCATSRPNVELVLAREAFTAAKEVESARYAPGSFHKAEEAFRHGMAYYNEHSYD